MAALVLSGSLALIGCAGASQATAPDPAPAATMSKSANAPGLKKGAYLTHERYLSTMTEYSSSRVVLFFHAPWCPDCRKTEKNLASSGVPDGLVVVKVDYDTATELKAKYGITKQHTFVLLDATGKPLRTFTGTFDGASIKDALT